MVELLLLNYNLNTAASTDDIEEEIPVKRYLSGTGTIKAAVGILGIESDTASDS